jgi:hypothetical protein
MEATYMSFARWTDEEFAFLSWHDNTIHGFLLIAGESGAGQLVFDIDHILEWRPNDDLGFSFLVAPATLTFRDVSSLKVSIDYATPTAALSPFTIDRIDRTVEKRQRANAVLWTLPINWPAGEITFEAAGFVMELRAAPLSSFSMSLPREPGGGGGDSG